MAPFRGSRFPCACRPSAQVAATPVSSQSLVLKPGALFAGQTYRFTLNAQDAAGSAVAEVGVVTAAAPRGTGPGSLGLLNVTAAPPAANETGARGDGSAAAPAGAFSTAFTLTASGWLDEDGPLLYQFQYAIEGQRAADGSPAPPVVLLRFQPGPAVAGVTLPPGLSDFGDRVTLQLCARRRVWHNSE
jgi:hypothetical protein